MEDATLLTALLISSLGCTTCAQIFQKKAAQLTIAGSLTTKTLLNHYTLASLFLLGSGLILWLGVLNFLDVSIAYPILALNYVLVLIASRVVFGETIPRNRWFGSVTIMTGIIVLLGAQ